MLGKFSWVPVILIMFAFGLPSDDIYDQKGYYLFPIRPGEINYLSGSMGELRATHFHTGIDIKTGGVEGYNVYAAADGFLNRVKVSSGGYGKALYIQHPNSTFTVYAHLKDFSREVADYVREHQYKKQSYEVDLFPGRHRFLYHKGDIIASSGNTGSSTAPHLHFEIRDENHKVLDPLRFGFPEIRDNRDPEIRTITFKTLDINSRVNNLFGRFDFDVKKIDDRLVLPDKVNLQGKIGIEVYAFDRQNDTNNRYGLPCIEFYRNGDLVYSYHIKTFSFSDQRNLLIHTNYPHMVNTGRRFHKLYIDDGNELSFYNEVNRGVIDIRANEKQQFSMMLWDAHGNKSEMDFYVNDSTQTSQKAFIRPQEVPFSIDDNVLKIVKKFENGQSNNLVVYANRFEYELEPAYTVDNTGHFLWDLRDGLPDSIDACGKIEDYNFKATVPADSEFSYYSENVDLHFGKKTLFDTLYLRHWVELDTSSHQEVYRFGHYDFPLRRNVKITLKPSLVYPDKDRSSVYFLGSRGKLSYVGGEWKGDHLIFYTRDLVDYTIATDSVPPVAKPIRLNARELRFIIDDKLSGIKSYEAFVAGEWVLMNYESKRNLIWSEKLDESVPFAGDLLLRVEDNAGNETIYQSTIK